MQRLFLKCNLATLADDTAAGQLIDISGLDTSNGRFFESLYKEMKKMLRATDRPATNFHTIYNSCRKVVEHVWNKTIDTGIEYETVPVEQMPKILTGYAEDVYKKTKKQVVNTNFYAPTCLPMYNRIVFPDKLAISLKGNLGFYPWDERYIKKCIIEELDHWMNYQVRGELGQNWWNSISSDFEFDRKVRYKYEALAQRNIEKICLQDSDLVIPTLYTKLFHFSICSFDPDYKELLSAYLGVLTLDGYGPELIAKIDYMLPTAEGLELVFNEKHPTYKQRVSDVAQALGLNKFVGNFER